MNAVLGFIDIEKCYPQIERGQAKKTGLCIVCRKENACKPRATCEKCNEKLKKLLRGANIKGAKGMSEKDERIERLTDEIGEAMYRCKEGVIPKAAAEMIIEKCNREIKKIKGEDKQ